jgi:hypothetical protein
MAQEPHRSTQENEKRWTNINQVMKDIGLPEFSAPNEFVDLRDIVKSHAKQDSLWSGKIAKVTDMAPGHAVVHGAPYQRSSHVATVKCQNSQVLGTCCRDTRDFFGPNGTT